MNKLLLSAIISGLIIAGTVGNMLLFLRGDKTIFRFFTILSNCFSALVSVPVLVCDVLVLNGQLAGWPAWLMPLRFVSVCSVMVTMLTVVFFLAPVIGRHLLYRNDNLYMHVLGPLLAAFSFLALEPGKIGFPLSLAGALPVLLYAPVYLRRVVYVGEKNGGWPDFYHFNDGGHWPVSFAAMVGGAAVLSLVMAWAHNL